MLHAFSELSRMTLAASDGDIGRIKDAYFDDERWTLRYLVVDTGSWPAAHRVLVTPLSVTHWRWIDQVLDVSLTRNQVEHGPAARTERPVSRQYEAGSFDSQRYLRYYWSGPDMQEAMVPVRGSDATAPRPQPARVRRSVTRDPHLRSAGDVRGHRIEATDGPAGQVEDFVFDDEQRLVRYLVVDTHQWRPGRRVLLPIDAIESIQWPERTVRVALTRDEVRNRPAYRDSR